MAKKTKQEVLVSYRFLPIFEQLLSKNQTKEATELIIAIIKYDMDGTIPQFSDYGVSFVWDTVIKPKLDENKEAYNETVKKRKAAGQQGGNAKAENSKSNQDVPNVPNLPNGSFANKDNQNNQELPKLPDNDNDVVIDVDVVNDSNNLNNPNGLFVTQECDEEEKGGKYQPIIDAWNELPVTSIKSIRGTRLKMVQARLKEYTMDEFLSAISNIRSSPWLLGRNRQNWMITFDWFVKPNNFQKVYEGNYIGVESKQYDPFAKNDMMAGYNGAMEKLEGLIDE